MANDTRTRTAEHEPPRPGETRADGDKAGALRRLIVEEVA